MGWLLPVKVLAILAVSVALHLALFFVLVLIPYSYFHVGLSDAEHADLIARNSVTEFFSAPPYASGLAILWSAMCLATVWMQRGQKNRYDGLAMLACALAVTGGFVSMASTNIAASVTDYRPIGLMQIGVTLLAASSLAGLVSLVRLLITRSERRGRVLALFCFVWAGIFGGAIYFLVLHPRCTGIDPPEMEFPVVDRADFDYLVVSKHMLITPPLIVWIDAAGVIRSDDDELWRPADGNRVDKLRAALKAAAERMPHDTNGPPDDVLHLRADARAPSEAVARVFEVCAEDEVGIWKFLMAASRKPFLQEGACDHYRVAAYTPRPASANGESTQVEDLNALQRIELVVDSSPGSKSGVVYRFMDEDLELPADVLAKWKAHFGEPWESVQFEFALAPDLPWAAAFQAMTRLEWLAANAESVSYALELTFEGIQLLAD